MHPAVRYFLTVHPKNVLCLYLQKFLFFPEIYSDSCDLHLDRTVWCLVAGQVLFFLFKDHICLYRSFFSYFHMTGTDLDHVMYRFVESFHLFIIQQIMGIVPVIVFSGGDQLQRIVGAMGFIRGLHAFLMDQYFFCHLFIPPDLPVLSSPHRRGEWSLQSF